jgi:hypothetical protein
MQDRVAAPIGWAATHSPRPRGAAHVGVRTVRLLKEGAVEARRRWENNE